ncbi:MAG: hypothetical protein KH009_09125 [Clostridiales bacterium]|nr:hypothetical protein [Clostridiales bacterium]
MAKAEFIARDNEQIFAERVSADCWNMPQVMGNRQISGKVYFTDQRVAFLASGLIGTKSVSWEIEMQNIASVETCTTPPFFPFGILITMKNGDRYKLGIMKREKYVDWLLQHIS